jgi:hypothetical protein
MKVYYVIAERKYDQCSSGDSKIAGTRKRNEKQIKKSKFQR